MSKRDIRWVAVHKFRHALFFWSNFAFISLEDHFSVHFGSNIGSIFDLDLPFTVKNLLSINNDHLNNTSDMAMLEAHNAFCTCCMRVLGAFQQQSTWWPSLCPPPYSFQHLVHSRSLIYPNNGASIIISAEFWKTMSHLIKWHTYFMTRFGSPLSSRYTKQPFVLNGFFFSLKLVSETLSTRAFLWSVTCMRLPYMTLFPLRLPY